MTPHTPLHGKINPNGIIVYQGPSMLDGAPIVMIATGLTRATKNGKTGRMIQTWIFRTDMHPMEAVKTSKDSSVCGKCKHRGLSCYVRMYSVGSVYKCFCRGGYRTADDIDFDYLAAIPGRDGSYGDPTAVPLDVWRKLNVGDRHRTGYTHQWADQKFHDFRGLMMASVDSEEERAQAKAMGWRTFRVRTPSEPLLSKEIVCPASIEAGHKTACEDCGLCDGAKLQAKKPEPWQYDKNGYLLWNDTRKDIVIQAHGATAKRFEEARKRLPVLS